MYTHYNFDYKISGELIQYIFICTVSTQKMKKIRMSLYSIKNKTQKIVSILFVFSSSKLIVQSATEGLWYEKEMERINSLICADPDTLIAKIKTILRPGGLEKYFERLLDSEVYLALNYDGVSGKRGFKEFKALHDALLDSVKEEGLTLDKFKKDVKLCFKTYKNRHLAKKKCREKNHCLN